MSSVNFYISLYFTAHSLVIYVTWCCFIISLLVKSLDKQCYHWFNKLEQVIEGPVFQRILYGEK